MTMTDPDFGGWDALLADGGVVHVRPIVAADAAALRGLHAAASDRSIYLRYFSVSRRSGEMYLDRLLGRPQQGLLALVAEQHGAVVGMASCERLPGTADAEVGLLVADAHQHRGVGTLLLEHLAGLARHHGLRRFVGEVLPENGPMLKVFADAGFAVTVRPRMAWSSSASRSVRPLRRRRRWMPGSGPPTCGACGVCWRLGRWPWSGPVTGVVRWAARCWATSVRVGSPERCTR
jgi:GNAT superfamily N-acetyltransferase